LTGQAPFSGATAGEVIEQVRGQEPIPPSQINPEVTRQLEAICLRCLHKNPWRRYRRAYDVSRGLRFCLEKL
jgi:hypothetical protein